FLEGDLGLFRRPVDEEQQPVARPRGQGYGDRVYGGIPDVEVVRQRIAVTDEPVFQGGSARLLSCQQLRRIETNRSIFYAFDPSEVLPIGDARRMGRRPRLGDGSRRRRSATAAAQHHGSQEQSTHRSARHGGHLSTGATRRAPSATRTNRESIDCFDLGTGHFVLRLAPPIPFGPWPRPEEGDGPT